MTQEELLEMLTRWHKNTPYPLPKWLDENFMKGVAKAQLAEINQHVKDVIGKSIPVEHVDGHLRERDKYFERGYNHAKKEQRKLAEL